MKLSRFLIGAVAALAFAGAAIASPVPYITTPFSTVNESVNAAIANINSSQASAASLVTCTGTTTSTCQGLRFVSSYSGLTTAAGVTSAAQTVTNASVVASSIIICASNGYAGTGNPNPVNIVPAAGSFTYQIQNSHASAALNATVPVACLVYN